LSLTHPTLFAFETLRFRNGFWPDFQLRYPENSISTEFLMATTESTTAKPAHAASSKIAQKENIYEAENLGSGTFRIVKPKRKDAKRRQSALKGTTRGARK
jgi:hypothetical protein